MTAKKYETTQVAKIEDVKRGEYVRRVRPCTTCKAKPVAGATCPSCDGIGYTQLSDRTYIRGEYERPDPAYGFKGGYSLTDFEDVNRAVPTLKKGTLVLVGFSF